MKSITHTLILIRFLIQIQIRSHHVTFTTLFFEEFAQIAAHFLHIS